MTMPVRDFYPAVGVDYSVHSYETIARLWLDEFNQKAVGVGLVSGALDAIRFFHGQGRSQSVLSASYEPSLRKQCEALGLTPYMTDISGLEDESASKKTEIGRRQLRELGLEGRDVVLIGDMLTDAHLAEDLGAACILVSWGHNDLKRLLSSGLPVARDFGELEEILKEY